MPTHHIIIIQHRLLILRAVQYNAQPLPVPGLPTGTALLTILPQALARVNHSCRPNAVLKYSIQKMQNKFETHHF